MRRSAMVMVVLILGLVSSARAYEYALQFTPNAGGRGLVTAGYSFAGGNVVGNCSYYITSGGSGRGGGYHSHTTYYDQTCTWDLYGNLLGAVAGAPVAPKPLASGNGLTIYAVNPQGDAIGLDVTRGFGFVDTPSAQYAWATKPNYVFPPNQQPLTLTLSLYSQGDYPLIVSKIDASALLATASVKSNTCEQAPVPVGKSCTIVVIYDARGLPGGDNPYTAYDTLTVGLVCNSGQAPDFSEPIEVPVAPAN